MRAFLHARTWLGIPLPVAMLAVAIIAVLGGFVLCPWLGCASINVGMDLGRYLTTIPLFQIVAMAAGHRKQLGWYLVAMFIYVGLGARELASTAFWSDLVKASGWAICGWLLIIAFGYACGRYVRVSEHRNR